MMRKVIWLIFLPLVISCDSRPEVKEQKKILIYTRNGEGYVHDNIDASVKALQEICYDINIETDVSDDPGLFTNENLLQYDGIIFSNTNNEAFLTDEQRSVFQAFIRSGKGFMGIHSASGSEREWPWYWSVLGGKFLRHPPFQSFNIRIIDNNHLSTDFLPETWEWEDECYYLHCLNPDIHVLLAADLTTVEDDERDNYPGTTFGDLFPLAWCHQFDGGREWYTALGHSPEHYSDSLFREHLKGGIEWVLELEDY
jgi:type 1 glutamine amidotransferase